MNRKKLTFILLLFFSAACGFVKQVVAYDVTVGRDEFKRNTYYEGTTLDNRTEAKEGAVCVYNLAAFRNDSKFNFTGTFVHVVSFYIGGSDWRQYNKALDLEGNSFEIVQVNHDQTKNERGENVLSETIGIGLPLKYLKDHAHKEMKFQISGDNGRGSEIISIPADYTRMFLAALR